MSAAKRVLVIGGGFAGMAAAIEMRKRDIAVDLVEVDAGWRSYGAGISLGAPTLRALKTVGVLDAFLQTGFAADGVDLLTPHGHLIASLPTPRLAGPDIPGGGAIMRPALARILADATRRSGVCVKLGQSFIDIAETPEGVVVTLTDRSQERYDLVIGADGLSSKVRQAIFPDAPAPRYTGQCVWRAVLPRPPEVTHTLMWLVDTVKTGINPVSQGEMYLFVTEDRPVNAFIDPADFPRLLAALLAPFTAPLMQSIRADISETSQIVYRPLEALLLPRPWAKGRVVLIGDAAHATTPHLASGACIGIEDGIVLADEIGRAATLPEGLAAFEDRRWERCRMVVENSNRLGEIEIEHGDKMEHGRIMRESMVALAAPI